MPHTRFVHFPGATELKEYSVEPAPRKHAVCSLAHLVALAAGHEFASIWHTDGAVNLCFDRTLRREFASMVLKHDPRYLLVKGLGERWYSPKEFVNLLRVSLRGAFEGPELIAVLSKPVGFKTTEETTSTAGRTKESVGKSIESEIKTEMAIPPEITLQIEMYTNFSTGGGFPVACALDVDLSEQKFQLCPFPGELEHLVEATHAALQAMITAGLPDGLKEHVYFGTI